LLLDLAAVVLLEGEQLAGTAQQNRQNGTTWSMSGIKDKFYLMKIFYMINWSLIAIQVLLPNRFVSVSK
jgi:hypothetical protein